MSQASFCAAVPSAQHFVTVATEVPRAPASTSMSTSGSCGGAIGQMRSPGGLAVDGNIAYVAETGNNRISAWNTDTRTVTRIIAPLCAGDTLLSPLGIAFDPLKQWLYVAETGRKRVVRIQLADPTVCEVVTTGLETPQKFFGGPRDVGFGPDGRLFVGDASRRVHAFWIAG